MTNLHDLTLLGDTFTTELVNREAALLILRAGLFAMKRYLGFEYSTYKNIMQK